MRRQMERPTTIYPLKLPQFDPKSNARPQVKVSSKFLQIIAEFIAAIELPMVLGRDFRQPFAKAGKLRGVLRRRRDKIWSLITPTPTHRVTLLVTNNIGCRIGIEQIFQCHEATTTGPNNGNFHRPCSLRNISL